MKLSYYIYSHETQTEVTLLRKIVIYFMTATAHEPTILVVEIMNNWYHRCLRRVDPLILPLFRLL